MLSHSGKRKQRSVATTKPRGSAAPQSRDRCCVPLQIRASDQQHTEIGVPVAGKVETRQLHLRLCAVFGAATTPTARTCLRCTLTRTMRHRTRTRTSLSAHETPKKYKSPKTTACCPRGRCRGRKDDTRKIRYSHIKTYKYVPRKI